MHGVSALMLNVYAFGDFTLMWCSSLVTYEAQNSLVLLFDPNVPDGICAFYVAKDII